MQGEEARRSLGEGQQGWFHASVERRSLVRPCLSYDTVRFHFQHLIDTVRLAEFLFGKRAHVIRPHIVDRAAGKG